MVEQPVRKSRRLSTSTLPQTSMEKPLELDTDEGVLVGQVAELADRMDLTERQVKEAAAKSHVQKLEKTVQDHNKELKTLKKLIREQDKILKKQQDEF